MEGRADPPPAAQLLGFRLIEIDPEEGTIEVAFTATEQFLNPAGTVQGGFLAAMLDTPSVRPWSPPWAMASGRRPPTCTCSS
jgi:acyl-coenzyme A thioesterase PaaI-like protein